MQLATERHTLKKRQVCLYFPVQRGFCYRSGCKNSKLIYLRHSPLDQRTTSHTGAVDFLKVVIWIAHVLAQHDLADVVPKRKKKKKKFKIYKCANLSTEYISGVLDSALKQCSTRKQGYLRLLRTLTGKEISWLFTKGSGVEFGTTEGIFRGKWSERDLTRTIRKPPFQS